MDATLIAAVIAATISLISLAVQAENNYNLNKMEEKKLNAEIISKSRIEWIQTVRSIMADYLTEARSLLFLFAQIEEQMEYMSKQDDNIQRQKIQVNINELIAEANGKLNTIFRLKNLLILNFSDNEGNKKIIEEFTSVVDYLSELSIQIKNLKIHGMVNYQTIDKLAGTARDYFKVEWDRAKNIQ
ncbi:hypothetical protein ACEN32_02560 [Marinilactibacillus psychrotolerans]|uniref:hypothetical protein n=1 Tax=Marinilactibacillus psychrotolerans TaxID=191770 RepID=UPI003888F724